MTRTEAIKIIKSLRDFAEDNLMDCKDADTSSLYEADIEALEMAIIALQGAGWISAKDQLPEKFQPVIVCRPGSEGEIIVEQGFKDVGDWWKVHGTRAKHVSHWMRLPEPPDELRGCGDDDQD